MTFTLTDIKLLKLFCDQCPTLAVPSTYDVCVNIKLIDISIKLQFTGQSTSMLKVYMYIMFDMVDAPFSYGRSDRLPNFFRNLSV